MSAVFICPCDALPPTQTRGLTVNTPQGPLDLFLIRTPSRILAYRNHCPHLGIPLNWQPDTFLSADNAYIQCATHGALFNIDNGACIAGPCSGQALSPLPIMIRDDAIWLLDRS